MKYKPFLALVLAFPFSASAQDMTWSGFGTVGYTQSDQPYNYQRFIDEQGTFKRDSLLGAQVDIKFDRHWGAAVQAKLAPSDRSDSQSKGVLSWAFVSWRPVDDVLLRLGKLRVPLMLNTENSDVGATYDFAHLPIEVYSIAPTTDFVGLSVSKSWFSTNLDWTLDAYYGTAKNYTRFYGRDTRDGDLAPGAWFEKFHIKSGGLVLSARSLDNAFRAGIHEAEASQADEIISDIPYRAIAPGQGIYDFASGRRVDYLRIPVQSISASVLLPGDVRLTSEYARIKVSGASRGLSRWGAYLALSRQFGVWNPYIYYAKTKSTDASLSLYRAVNGNISPMLPPAINAYQRLSADIVSPYEQWTVAAGTSFRLGTRSLIKTEWAQTHTGEVSSFIDAPSGGDSAGKRINVFSLSYSFSF